MRQVWIRASLALLFATGVTFSPSAGAQHRGGAVTSAPARPAAPAAPRASGVVPRLATPFRVPARTSVGGVSRVGIGGAPIRVASQGQRIHMMSGLSTLPSFATSFGTPGLGFDFPHMAAINSGRGLGRHSRFNNGAPFGFGGFLLTSPEVIVVEGQPAENIAPEEEANGRANNNENLEGQFLPASSRLGAALPVRDAAEYVFVRRDGALLFGVAYSWDNGTLRYVTREGQRRSVSQDALDMDATQQFNEQRGVNFRTPA
jgi:hypothetical protein